MALLKLELKTALSALAVLLLAGTATASAKGPNFKELSLKDYTEMDALVRQTLGRNTIDDVEREPKVRKALEIVLSRRDTDGKRKSLVTSLQRQLPEAFFLLSVQKVAESAIQRLKDTSASNLDRATSYVVLENLMAEFSPRAFDYQSTFELIAKADIEIDDELGTFRRIEGMSNNVSPSSLAAARLNELKRDKRNAKIAESPDLEY